MVRLLLSSIILLTLSSCTEGFNFLNGNPQDAINRVSQEIEKVKEQINDQQSKLKGDQSLIGKDLKSHSKLERKSPFEREAVFSREKTFERDNPFIRKSIFEFENHFERLNKKGCELEDSPCNSVK